MGLIGNLWNINSQFYSGPLICIGLFAPIYIGYTYNAFPESWTLRFAALCVVISAVFGVYTQTVFQFGRGKGLDLIKQAAPLYPSLSVAPRQLRNGLPAAHYPVERKTASDLGDGSLYQYNSTESDFLRLILQDEASYYVIESRNGQGTPHAFRKDLIEEIVFSDTPRAYSAPSGKAP